ncbi:MAG: M1 family peptidase [Bacteroidetes bacterium]|nr:M1 family peptidase [Bacteroidota bacterium]
MKRISLSMLLLLTAMVLNTKAQDSIQVEDTAWKTLYRATPEKKMRLVHTQLAVRFDIPNARMYGTANITVQPHFYPQNNLQLDAKGMEIKSVMLVEKPTNKKLNYQYNDNQLNITLDKTYSRFQPLTVRIEYIAKPNELKASGSAAITDAKGLYFINPDGKDPKKPTQIWTQGETEATSVWCPTIDKPNQKTTQEISMTVPAKWVTLSNGLLIKQQPNPDGTRTDTWKMDQPHAPYLFFMGAGEFSVIKDKWRGKEVSYYVEKEYAPVARKIFGNTPEMMDFFSTITGVDYPWSKYAQMVGRDFVSGAMENTTATLHQESAQQDARSLIDGNSWEETIAHELFHHWFGDYVTTESWSNLTVNESFANYSEYLWNEYKYGKDRADASNFTDMQGYLFSESESKHLVRFYYKDKEEMFDAVSYNKGGRILHMLRNYLGDSAFFKSLQLYLTSNKFKAAEAHQLRLAFEEVSGKDLNWFFNQWYFDNGHPKLDIRYQYDSTSKKAVVVVKQTQKEPIFSMPVYIDIYHGKEKKRHEVWIKNAVDSFAFEVASAPDLIQFDGERTLLCTRKENKTMEAYIHQYAHTGKYLDRKEAIDYMSKKQDNKLAPAFFQSALKDAFSGLRTLAINQLDLKKKKILEAVEPLLVDIAQKDNHRPTRAAAVDKLATLKKETYRSLYFSLIQDSSYSLSGAALNALYLIAPDTAIAEAKKLLTQKLKGSLLENAAMIATKSGDLSGFENVLKNYDDMPLGQSKFNLTTTFVNFLGEVGDTEKLKKGIDAVVAFRKAIPAQYGIAPIIDNMFKGLIKRKETAKKEGGNAASLEEQIEYVRKNLSE